MNIFWYLVLNLSDFNTRLHQFKICCCKADAKNCSHFLHPSICPSVPLSIILSIILSILHPSVHHAIIFLSYVFGLLNAFIWTDSREQTGNHWVEREGNRIGEGPQDRIWTRVSTSAVVLCVGALTTRLLALTSFYHSYHSSIFLSIHHQSVHCSIASSIVLSIILFIHPSIVLSIVPAIIHPSIHPSFFFYLSIIHSSSIVLSFCSSSIILSIPYPSIIHLLFFLSF